MHRVALIAFSVLSALSALAASCHPQGADESDPTARLFDPDHILEVRIELPRSDWDRIRSERRDEAALLAGDCLARPFARPFSWARARVTVLGQTLDAVGVRKKGFLGSLDRDKPSLKLKFDQYAPGQRLLGAREMTLNNAVQDRSLVRQCLAYRVFAGAGIPAPRCNFARVQVGDGDLGVYVHVEGIDKSFLARHFADTGGSLHEGTFSDFRPGWLGTFERKGGKRPGDRSDLAAVAAALETPDLRALSAEIDLDAFLRFWAAETLVGHRDGYAGNANNFFVYRDPSSRLLSFLPWGADSAFKDGSAMYSAGALAHRLAGIPEMRRRYRAELERLLDQVWNERALAGEIQRMEALLEPALSVAEWRQTRLAIAGVRSFVHTRRRAILGELALGPGREQPLRARPCLDLVGEGAP